MKLVLDTSTVIEILRGRRLEHQARLHEARQSGSDIRLSTIVLHELMYGAFRSARVEHQLRLIERLVSDLQIDAWGSDDALAAAAIRAQLDEAGRSIGLFDTMIAAHAIGRGAVLVTANLRHFARIAIRVEGLQLMDWSVSDQPLDRAALMASLRARPQE